MHQHSGKPSIDLNETSNRAVALIVIALLFLGGWWLIARNTVGGGAQAGDAQQDTTKVGTLDTTMPSLTTTTTPVPTTAGEDSIVVADQGAGDSVMIKQLTVSSDDWIAIRDKDGRTLGAARFSPGSYTNAKVPLLRATTAGQRYQALIYVDDGDKQFDLHKDTIALRSDGTVEGTTFSVTQ